MLDMSAGRHYRGDSRGTIELLWMALSTSQFVSVVIVPVSSDAALLAADLAGRQIRKRRARRRDRLPRRSFRPWIIRLPDADTSKGERRTVEVDPEYDGVRLDSFLTALLPEQSRSQIQRLIKDGHVTGAASGCGRAPPSARDNTSRSTFPRPVAGNAGGRGPAAPDPVRRSGRRGRSTSQLAWSCIPAAGHSSGTLVNALLHHVTDLSGIGGELRPGIVHRLDRGTSGLMVVAKNDRAHQELSRQFSDREVEKEYIALVWGVVHAGRRIDAAIGRDPTGPAEDVDARAARAQRRHARHLVAHHFQGVSLLKVAIATGRTHQIRVHLSAIGHPIVGDAVYGGVHRRVAGEPAGGDAAGAAVSALGAAVLHAPGRRPAGRVRFAAAAGPRVGHRRHAEMQEGEPQDE